MSVTLAFSVLLNNTCPHANKEKKLSILAVSTGALVS